MQQLDLFEFGVSLMRAQQALYKEYKALNICPNCGRNMLNDVVCDCILEDSYFASRRQENNE